MVVEACIRRARPADVPSIVVLCAEHAAYEGSADESGPAPAALAQALFGTDRPLVCWVAAADEEILGYATGTREFSTWQAAYYLHMDCLYLKPESRRCGLGQRLMQALASDAVNMACTGMQWQTPASNADAVSFYRRTGAESKAKLRFYLDMVQLRRIAGTL